MLTFEVKVQDIVEIRSLVELKILANLLKKLLRHPMHGKIFAITMQ